ncbi:hypothetical protein BS78_02G138000 [Paspalum vaginatum]|nr:hypothetical protein BS78_02G138000 [Paspalum vaginatum]
MTFGPHQPLPLLSLASGPQPRTLSHRPLPPSSRENERSFSSSRRKAAVPPCLSHCRPPLLSPWRPLPAPLPGAPPCSSLRPLPASPWRPLPAPLHGAPPCSSLRPLPASPWRPSLLPHGAPSLLLSMAPLPPPPCAPSLLPMAPLPAPPCAPSLLPHGAPSLLLSMLAPSCSSFPCRLPMAPPLPAPHPPLYGLQQQQHLPACSSKHQQWQQPVPSLLVQNLGDNSQGTLVIKRDDVQEAVEYTIMKSWYSLEE